MCIICDVRNLILIINLKYSTSVCATNITYTLRIYRNMRKLNDENELKDIVMISVSSQCGLFLSDNCEITCACGGSYFVQQR